MGTPMQSQAGDNHGTAPITVAIPTIPPRAGTHLRQAVASVHSQTLQPAGGVAIATDMHHEGAAATRQKALDAVQTEWVAFLDDDDLMYPHHLSTLWHLARNTGAEFVWSWFDGNDPFPQHRGRQMDLADYPHNMHHTTMTVMVRTELARAVGFTNHPDATPDWPGEDWAFILGCGRVLIERHGVDGATRRFAHTPEITWHYRCHGRNTSGLASRW